ncbi:MAG: MBL fold metallo-hydrolase [Breznakibacter sp.]
MAFWPMVVGESHILSNFIVKIHKGFVSFMKVTFLGTGTSQGVPVIGCGCEVCCSSDRKDNRLRSSVLVQYQGLNILIDAGPDFRYQMLKHHVHHLDAILLTHEHRDHISGLDDVRAFNAMSDQPIPVYAEQRVANSVRTLYHYAFSDLPFYGLPQMSMLEIGEEPFCIESVLVSPIRVMHHRLPILAYRIGDFGYVTDANHISDASIQQLVGCKILVVNGLRIDKHISHFSLSEALAVMDRVKPDLGIITHISHQLGLHEEVAKQLPANVILGYDGLCLKLDNTCESGKPSVLKYYTHGAKDQ